MLRQRRQLYACGVRRLQRFELSLNRIMFDSNEDNEHDELLLQMQTEDE